jgi:integrase
LANAIKWRDQQKSKADLGELGEKLEEIEAMQEPLKTLVVRYMASRFLTTKKTARKEWRSMQTLLEHPLGSRLFNRTIYEWSKEGRKFLREYIDHRLSSPGVSLPGVMRELSPIQHLFNIARTEWGYEIGGPFKGIFRNEKKAYQPREPFVLDAEHDAKILKAVNLHFKRDDLKLRWITMIIVALTTGLRRGVIGKLKWRDIDFDKKLISIPRSYCDPKKNAPPYIPLTNRMYWLLKCYREIAVVKETKSTPMLRLFPVTNGYFERVFRSIVETADVYRYREDGTKDYPVFHDLKHTAGTRYRVGMKPIPLTPDESNYLLEHKDSSMNAHYTVNNVQALEWTESIRIKLDNADHFARWSEDNKHYKPTDSDVAFTLQLHKARPVKDTDVIEVEELGTPAKPSEPLPDYGAMWDELPITDKEYLLNASEQDRRKWARSPKSPMDKLRRLRMVKDQFEDD